MKQRMTTYAQNWSFAKYNLHEHGTRIETAGFIKDIESLYRSNERKDLIFAEKLLILRNLASMK